MEVPCYSPIQGYSKQGGGFTTSRREGWPDRPLQVPCGQCIGCRLERSRQWAIRCVHEKQLHEDNSFITLTYNDDHLPDGGTLVRKHFVDFMKRLRRKVGPVRVFYCGEYGDETLRPHYHACLFGYRPPDPELFSMKNEIPLYTSPSLRERWGMGHATFGELNFETAAYCARYVTKKVTGDAAHEHYRTIDPDTGEIFDRLPEFNGMSRRPGIGLPWLQKYGKDSYSKDEIILRDRAMKPPRAYDKAFEHIDPQLWRSVRIDRAVKNFERYHPVNRDPDDVSGGYNRFKARDKITRDKMQKGAL